MRALSRHFGLGIDDWEPSGVEPPPRPVIELDGSGKSEEQTISDAVLATYQVAGDDRALRENPDHFEHLRGDYPVRREFDSHSIEVMNVPAPVVGQLKSLGFKLEVDES